MTNRVVLFYGDTAALLICDPRRDRFDVVVAGLVVNGSWRLEDFIGDAEYTREVAVPENFLGDYNNVINWARTQP